jgi:hypothetical protein
LWFDKTARWQLLGFCPVALQRSKHLVTTRNALPNKEDMEKEILHSLESRSSEEETLSGISLDLPVQEATWQYSRVI